MQYTLLFYETKEDVARRAEPAQFGEFMASWGHYVKALMEAGVVVSGTQLSPPETTTVLRRQGSESLVQDGPITDTKEQLAGFFVIEVPDLDTALKWAERSPSKAIEVRQNLPRIDQQ